MHPLHLNPQQAYSPPLCRRVRAAAAVGLLSCCLATTGAGHAQPATATEPAALRTFELRLIDGALVDQADVVRVSQGDRVALVWTTDAPVSLHLHGYDLEFEVLPGTAQRVTFLARATGRFPITRHDPAGEHEHTTLLYLEVYPR